MKRILATLAAAFAVLSTATQAYAQADEAKMRQEAMQEKLNEAYEKTRPLPGPGSKDVLIVPTSSNGFKFKSADGNFEGAIGGRIYSIFRKVIGDHTDGGAAADTFAIDTARINLSGTFYKEFPYVIEYEAANKGTAAALTAKEVHLGWKSGDHGFRFGLFKSPFSQEETCSSRWIEFAERSIVNRIVPGFDQGIQYTGSFFEKMLSLELGFFNGSGVVADTNDEKDLVLRVRVNPFLTGGDSLKNLRIGIAMTMGDLDTTAVAAGPDITTGDVGGITIANFGAVTLDGERRRMGIEISYIFQGFQARLEYVTVDQDIIAPQDDSYQIVAWYLQLSYILTGEEKPLENRIKPLKNFSPSAGTWGAVEIALRIANLDVSDAEDVGAIAATANQKTQEMTFGANWWWTSNIRVQADVFNFTFDEDIVFANGDHSDLRVFYVRFQVDF